MEHWNRADSFGDVREKVNGNFEGVESALTALSGALTQKEAALAGQIGQVETGLGGEIDALETALTGQIGQVRTLAEGKADVVLGAYTGDDASSRTISLGFQPRAVFLITQSGITANAYGSITAYGGLAMVGNPVVAQGTAVEVTATGFRLSYGTAKMVNMSGWVYHYAALR